MKLFAFFVAKPATAIALALLASGALSACGGGNHNYSFADGGGTPSPAEPTPVRDAFFAAVSGAAAASSDTTEANDIDAVASTAPEDTEPESLG